jgi:hypothetical protein
MVGYAVTGCDAAKIRGVRQEAWNEASRWSAGVTGRDIAKRAAEGKMEFMQLEMSVAVVEQRSWQAAATRVLRTQPAICMAIKKLEREIAESLFRPSNRSYWLLTQTGRSLLRLRRSIDTDTRRLYDSHTKQLEILDADSLKTVGVISETPGFTERRSRRISDADSPRMVEIAPSVFSVIKTLRVINAQPQ